MKGFPFRKLFNIHVGGEAGGDINPRLGLLKIRSKTRNSKIHSYLFVKFFVVIF